MIEGNICDPQTGKTYDQLEKKVNFASNKLKNLIFMNDIRKEKESTDWKKYLQY